MDDLVARVIAFVAPLLPGFLAGYLLGRLAKKAFGMAMTIAAIILVGLFLLSQFGIDTSTLTDWLRLGSSWAGDKVDGAMQYFAVLLPTAAAIGVGFKIGFGNRRI